MTKFCNVLLVFLFALQSCSHRGVTPTEQKAESAKINQFFDDIFESQVARYPTWQTYLGRKTNYHLLDNETEEYSENEYQITKKNYLQLQKFNYDALDEQTKLSYKILKYELEQQIEGFKWRYHSYPLNQMFGYQSETPAFLINMHEVSELKDAEAYISRLKEIKRVFDERLVFIKKQEQLGILPPQFVFPKVLGDAENILKGKPFKGTGESPLYSDFKQKIDRLKVSSSIKNRLLKEAQHALINYVRPAYLELMAYLKTVSLKATQNHGVWALPDGKDYYKFRLSSSTTTKLSADEIHAIGLKEVARIQNEMLLIMKRVGFKGSLQEFFNHMRGKKYFYPNNLAGRKAYLKEVDLVLARIKEKLPELFKTMPQAELLVKPVEAYREKSAGTAFYTGPSLEGNRPGIYYVNLYKMEDNPKYKLEALAYHEAIPGHHMQIALASEMKDLPTFRRSGGFTAYSEGWGLYAESLPKEIGFYQDPYSDFGRLSMEIWRATRLVVDTGIHAKKWTREEAIKFMRENTPSAELETIKEIERYFVMPGQATAYKVGMMKILALREKAKKALGEKFDLREFHQIVLGGGSLPLEILEEKVNQWIASFY